MLKHTIRAFAVAAMALALALPAAAHHVTTPAAVRNAPGPEATAVAVQGQVQEIVVTSRVDGTTRRVPILVAGDGRRYTLNGNGATGLLPGDSVAIAGMADGGVLFPESIDFLAGTATTASVGSTTLNGTLRLGHVDKFDAAQSEFFFAVVTDDGQQVRVALAALLSGLENGMRVSVTGDMLSSDEIAPTDIVILSPGERDVA